MLRKNIIFAVTLCTLAACGPKKESTITEPVKDTGTTTPPVTKTNDAPAITLNKAISQEDYSAGLALVSNSDCLGCHKTDTKLIGPAYQEIARKYPIDKNTKSQLADKIINGGSGVWGQVPMQPHPTISKKDASLMVEYILAMKDN